MIGRPGRRSRNLRPTTTRVDASETSDIGLPPFDGQGDPSGRVRVAPAGRRDRPETGMKRKTLALTAIGGLLVAACGAAGLRWAASQAPDFYAEALADPPAPEVREQAAREFAEQTAELVQDLRYAATWEQEFTQTQVNAWLAEELPLRYGDKIPKGVADPRVEFDDGLVRIGFQLSTKGFDGVVSLDLRPNVPEPNRLTIGVESLSAGLLPLSPASFTNDVSKQLDRYGVEHEWRVVDGVHLLDVTVVPRTGDNPVLEEIAVDDERVRIAGHRERPAVVTMRTGTSRPTRL